jgi:glutamate-1-semialdehyde 2,1-aminomutase
MKKVDRARLDDLMRAETKRFVEAHPKSQELYARARSSLLGGVPMNWMVRWAGSFPVFVTEASGAHFTDVDGHHYVDLCLGDTGAMTGHSPERAVAAIQDRVASGITMMLPTEDSVAVGEELTRRFGLPYWQFTLTATDANRFVIRLARHITGVPKILVFNGCYHGTVDETFVELAGGEVRLRTGSIGPPVQPRETTRVVEFNDLESLEQQLSHGDVACVLAEPAMTNIGIILPDEGYHDGLRELTRAYSTLLVIDETHTLCCGPGGYTRAHGLSPDIVTMGKPIGSGVPSGAYGISEEVAERIESMSVEETADVGGIGGTLAGNALSLTAMRATLENVLTDEAFAHMIPLAERFELGVGSALSDHAASWHVTRLGCRVEYRFQDRMPRNGGEAALGEDPELDAFMHLYALNRGVLMTPFHNMALMSPATTTADVDRHTNLFRSALEDLWPSG